MVIGLGRLDAIPDVADDRIDIRAVLLDEGLHTQAASLLPVVQALIALDPLAPVLVVDAVGFHGEPQ
jgi:hypothetical protein